MTDMNEKIVMRAGIYAFLAYSVISIALYALIYFTHIGNYKTMLNTGLDVLLSIPIYVIIVSMVFSYKRIMKKRDFYE